MCREVGFEKTSGCCIKPARKGQPPHSPGRGPWRPALGGSGPGEKQVDAWGIQEVQPVEPDDRLDTSNRGWEWQVADSVRGWGRGHSSKMGNTDETPVFGGTLVDVAGR